MKRIINLEKITKSYKRRMIINKFSYTFESGKVYGFQGANGSGKTVLFKMLLGFLKPDSGTVTIDGKKLFKEIEFPPDTGFIIEYPAFLNHYSGKANLKLLASVKNQIGEQEINKTLEQVGLGAASNTKVKHYSLGMKQRLGIAQAYMENPSLIILDEPTNALDKKGIADLVRLIKNWKEEGKCVLLTSHLETFLREVSDHLFIFEDSEIEEEVIST